MKIIIALTMLLLSVDGFAYTITPGGEFAVTWQAAPVNPYEIESYVAVGDFVTPDVLVVAGWAPLEVKSAACLAGLACDVTWHAAIPDLPCHDYDGVIVLGERQFEFYEQRVGCDGYKLFVPVVGR